ncbi:hypothetical protein [Mixta theicola]|nr:hypothetical protein [Mixta theicola]
MIKELSTYMKLFQKNNLPFQAMALLLLPLIPLQSWAAAQSGIYEALMIAVTPQHEVKGFYHQPPEDNANQRCAFWFYGRLDTKNAAPITSWSMQTLTGDFRFQHKQIELTLPHGQQHTGCMNHLRPEIETGESWSLTRQTNWIDLVTIRTDKAHLYRKSNSQAQHRGYVIKGDTLGLIQRGAEWSQVEYVSDAGNTLLAWIKNSDYVSLPAQAAALQ